MIYENSYRGFIRKKQSDTYRIESYVATKSVVGEEDLIRARASMCLSPQRDEIWVDSLETINILRDALDYLEKELSEVEKVKNEYLDGKAQQEAEPSVSE